MPHFTTYNKATGQIIARGSAATEESCLKQIYHDNEAVLLGDVKAGNFIDLATLEPVAYPPQPSAAHIFNYTTRAWFDPRTVEDLRDQARKKAAADRWALETGGIVVDGISIDTSREARAALAQTVSDMVGAGLEQIDFKARSGFVRLTLEQVRGIARAVTVHVQSSFSKERATVESIDALQDIEALKSFAQA